MAKPVEVIVHLRRQRLLENAGGATIWCNVTSDGGTWSVITRLSPGQYPEFDGEGAWFRTHRYPKKRIVCLEHLPDHVPHKWGLGAPEAERAGL